MSNDFENPNEVLFRQIHPSFIQDGKPSSQPFMPSPKDENKLSVDRSTISTARDSFERYTGDGFSSAAVYGMSVGELSRESIPCISDPIKDDPQVSDNPAHALADYSQHNSNQQKLKAKRLKIAALARGQIHP